MSRDGVAARVQAAQIWLVFQAFRILPLDVASAVGGWLGRTIGTRLPVSRRARRNLERVYPELSAVERERIVVGMWDNLGRTAAEYPHLPEFGFGPGQRVEVVGAEHLTQVRDDGLPGLFFSGHFANWEIGGYCTTANGIPVHMIYRAANNPHVEWIYRWGRDLGVELIPKGAAGARRALAVLKRGEHLGMLVDQKMNDGIAIPFFGLPAMTAPALATFALKFRCPVVPWHMERLHGAHFRLVIDPPFVAADTGDHHADIRSMMTEVNQRLERWIRANPEQWLWLHKRWPE